MNPRVLLRNTEVIENPVALDTLTPRYTEQALQFLRESKASPFFLYMPHTYPHIPLAASNRFRGKSPLGLYGDVVEEIDWSVGEVLGALKQNGLDQNTLVMFSSDNGPWYQGSPGKLRGRKNSTYEGGIREPFIARWPGRIPKGRVSHALCSLMDVFPTVTKLTSGALPGNATPAKPLDGIDIWPVLSGQKASIEREALLYFDRWDLQCARWNNWKLHLQRHNSAPYTMAPAGGRQSFVLPHPELYDLANDPDESYDVAAQNPQIVAQIAGRVRELMKGFPGEVQKAWADAEARKVFPDLPTGAWPRPPQ